MKKWNHLNFENRKTISSGIAHKDKLVIIAERVDKDPRSISKEVKRNRIPIDYKDGTESKCTKLKKWPFVCSNCKYRYSDNCIHVKYKYDASIAQRKADANLINSRKGIDVDSEEFEELNQTIKKGIEEGKSIYQIKIENPASVKKSLTTVYGYINKGYLTTKRIDLPYAVKYKKRKQNKKYAYSNNNIDRTGHTYLDYLSYIHKNPRINVWQLDFLGAIKSDSNCILTFILPNVHFTVLDIIKNPNSDKVVKFFDNLEEKIGIENFINLIPVILTDRDPCFTNIEGICFSKITGEKRCEIFYCDPYVSNQKPHVENINKQIRKFFPKGKTVDNLSKKDVLAKNEVLLNSPIKSLDGYTPKDAFNAVYGEDLYFKIMK